MLYRPDRPIIISTMFFNIETLKVLADLLLASMIIGSGVLFMWVNVNYQPGEVDEDG